MTIRTISLAIIESGQPSSRGPLAYAPLLAKSFGACLEAAIAVPPLLVPALAYSGYSIATQMMMFVEQENAVRTQHARATAAALEENAAALRLEARVSVLSAIYDPPATHMLALARVSDLCVVSAPDAENAWGRDLLVDLLFGAGTPLVIVPPEWDPEARFRSAIVGWDGGRAAARAVRDSLSLLQTFDHVEIVGVEGEKNLDADFAIGIESHLKRHCKAVASRLLPFDERGVAASLTAHAQSEGADLLVMGAYGHSRFREFVLGGATRDMLTQFSVPTLMSH